MSNGFDASNNMAPAQPVSSELVKYDRSKQAAALAPPQGVPPVLVGTMTPQVKIRVENFYGSVADIFDRWVAKRRSEHTQRAYREDVMAFVNFLGIDWPKDSAQLLMASVQDVQNFRDHLIKQNRAPKTLNRRISSLSGFYKYLAACAAELRLPIMVPNPAHAQFIPRDSTDPVEETRDLSLERVKKGLNSVPPIE